MTNKADRVMSLDVFRGLTVAGMILVNNPGDWGHVYAPLLHAKWHGCTPTDLVFPFFLFIVGVSISFSMWGVKDKPEKHGAVLKKVIIRSLKLIGIGLFLSGFPYFNLETLRLPGVLQRIGIVFFFAGFIFLKTSWKAQLQGLVVILLTYWAVMTLIPVPGVGTPNLDDPNMTIAGWFDNFLLEGHMWSQSKTWDPEGLLSTLPAIGTGLIGVLTGTWIRTEKDEKEKVAWMFVAGVILVVLGSWWDYFFPINKSLWTSSYVLYAGGMGVIGLAFSYWLIDVKKIGRKVTFPFLVFGINPMFAFVLSGLLVKILIAIKIGDTSLRSLEYDILYKSWLDGTAASFAHAVGFVLLMYLPTWWLYKKNIILKV
ncbi:DUF5009 domain-containing protein [Limibacter armeniacum]|uniref:acyltransferase family protein n=1 Tax=Limibacter armeniacum TaxID=466084 RepID=UPI002FE6ADE2